MATTTNAFSLDSTKPHCYILASKKARNSVVKVSANFRLQGCVWNKSASQSHRNIASTSSEIIGEGPLNLENFTSIEFWCSRRRRHGGQKDFKSKINPKCLLAGMGNGFWDGPESSESSSSEHQPNHQGGFRKSSTDPSVLLHLIQEVEPLDVSLLSAEASVASMDAMKRTISGMLGLLPSDQFDVSVKMERQPLERLLVSAMMTGYTLRNAEYRLSLRQTLDLTEDEMPSSSPSPPPFTDSSSSSAPSSEFTEPSVSSSQSESKACNVGNTVIGSEKVPEPLGELSPAALAYIQQLQAKLSAKSEELDSCKRKLAELEVENVVADEDNDLLDYLRSLDSEKVAELSQPTSPEVEGVVKQVIDRLLGSLGPSFESSSPSSSSSGPQSSWQQSSESSSGVGGLVQFQASFTATRDYLARLLFWCMLLGHHMRALEYRLELSHTFSLHADVNA